LPFYVKNIPLLVSLVGGSFFFFFMQKVLAF
jgi:hypothetical protein